MGNQGIIGDIGYLYMENVGFGLIFDGKWRDFICLLNQIFKCLPCGNIEVSRYGEFQLPELSIRYVSKIFRVEKK